MNGSCTDQYSQEGSDDHGTYRDCGGRLCGPGVRPPVSANSVTATQLQAHGWTCPTPGGLPHCRPPAQEAGAAGGLPEISILVFDPTGTELLGTEHLVRPDLYNGQPCPNDPDPVTGGYALLGNGYYGCHHFVP
jgi:hypothetical protein